MPSVMHAVAPAAAAGLHEARLNGGPTVRYGRTISCFAPLRHASSASWLAQAGQGPRQAITSRAAALQKLGQLAAPVPHDAVCCCPKNGHQEEGGEHKQVDVARGDRQAGVPGADNVVVGAGVALREQWGTRVWWWRGLACRGGCGLGGV